MLRATARALAIPILLVSAPMATAATPVPLEQTSTVVEVIGGHRVAATLTTHDVAIGKPGDPIPAVRTNNCTDSRYPCSLVDDLAITVDGRAIAVPRSAFGAFADVRSIGLHKGPSGAFVLTLTGGDASESYTAEIVFDRRRVRARTITDSEAGMAAEKTVYFDLSNAFH